MVEHTANKEIHMYPDKKSSEYWAMSAAHFAAQPRAKIPQARVFRDYSHGEQWVGIVFAGICVLIWLLTGGANGA
jgi:hypothetical protein